MYNRFLFLFVFIVFSGIGNLSAQSEATYSQYIFNGLLINPAYAGSQECLNLNTHARKQWWGMDGAPTSLTFSAHTPIKNDKISLGTILYNDRIGVTNQNGFAGIYAYSIKFNNNHSLSMGLQAFINNFRTNFSTLNSRSTNDPSFFNADVNFYHLNFGGGLFYSAPNYFIGLSVPNIQDNFLDRTFITFKQRRQYFMNGGFVIDLNEDVKIKPQILIRYIEGSATHLDLNGTIILKEVLWLGISYRSAGAVVLFTQLKLSNQLTLAYAFDRQASFQKNISRNSHEIMLNYRWAFIKTQAISPKYF